MPDNSFYAFDETLKNADDHTVGIIGDYLIYLNKEAITTQNCWDDVVASIKFTPTQLIYLRGLFENEFISIDGKTPEESIIIYLNYISQFRSLVLITGKVYNQQGRGEPTLLTRAVKIKTPSSFISEIEADEDFEVWKLKTQREMLSMQQMDTAAKQAAIAKIDEKLNKKTPKSSQ